MGNPLLVGVSAQAGNCPTLALNRKALSRVEKAVNPVDFTELEEWRSEMERRAEAVERKNHRIWYKDSNPFGNKIHAVQKSRGKSTPLI